MPGGGTSVLPRRRRFGFSAGMGLDAELIRRVAALGRTSEGRRGDVTEALVGAERDAVAVLA